MAAGRRSTGLPDRQRWFCWAVIAVAVVALGSTVGAGMALERTEHSPLVRVGQPAPDFTLPASFGGTVSLSEQREHAVLLAFLPSVQCGACKTRLRRLDQALTVLTREAVAVYAISTDEPAVQRTVASGLGLGFPLLAEDVVIGRHPAGRAYGVFHAAGPQQGPVDAAALVVIDAGGVVRGFDTQPADQLTVSDIEALVSRALATQGSV